MRVVPVARERLPHAAGVMARAFSEDPMLLWSLGGSGVDHVDSADIESRMTRYFVIVNEYAVSHGMMWETAGGEGACVWFSPDATGDFAKDELTTRPRLTTITLDGGTRVASMWDWVEAHIPAEPVWYLDQIGVEPSARGRGIGAALIEHGLTMARAAGQAAFLETGNPRNVAYYERFGFRTVAEGHAPDGGPHIWFMRCEP